jgi:urea transport system ATP-binding protein
MLEVSGLDVAYGRAQVLFDVSLEVPDDGLACVMGRNGVGKTTLLNSIMGVLKASSGRIRFDGRDITKAKPYDRVRAGLAYVPQGRGGFPQLTVRENLDVVQEASKRSSPAAVNEALDLFPRLVPLLGRKAGFLSGGQQQQLAIARALVTRPMLLVLDEPTEGIQPSIIHEIEDAITQLSQSEGLSILLVEQYVEFALRMADRYVVLDAGRVIDSGDTRSLDDAKVRQLLAV